MNKTLILAEKNSIAKEIIKALDLKVTDTTKSGSASFFKCETSNKEIVFVSSSGGHLGETEMLDFNNTKIENIPVIPQELTYNIEKSKKSVFSELKSIKKTVNKVIHFGDCGQEGEVIQRKIIELLNIDENNVSRAWYSEVTPIALKEAYLKAGPLKEPTFQNLYNAGITRSITDWAIGMNYSFLLKTSIGRVITPIVFAVFNRTNNFYNHKKEPFWYLLAKTNIENLNLKFKSKNSDENIFENLNNKELELEITHNLKDNLKHPKPLYNLNDLQVDCKTRAPKKTLEIAQSLYEKGIITYPRTDENKLSPNESYEKLAKIYKCFNTSKAEIIANNPQNKRLFLGKGEVTDHTAIIPTEKSINSYTELKGDEKEIFDKIVIRFLQNFTAPAELKKLESSVIIQDGETEHLLTSNIEAITKKGYLEIAADTPDDDKKEIKTNLETLEKIVKVNKSNFITETKQDFTKPKPLFTETSLMQWLDKGCRAETKRKKELANGIGTPATRASILEKCFTKDFIKKIDKQKVVFTEKGKEYCENIINIDCQELGSVELTAEMESHLIQLRAGKLSIKEYNKIFSAVINETCDKLKANYQTKEQKESKFICPSCNKTLLETKKGIKCKDECLFLPKVFAKTNIEKYFEILLNGEITEEIKFTSKVNKPFTATLLLKDNKLEMSFDNQTEKTEKVESKFECPKCKTMLLETEKSIFCNKCSYKNLSLPKIFAKTNIEKYFELLLNGEKTEAIKFTSKANKSFIATLGFNVDKNELKPEFINK